MSNHTTVRKLKRKLYLFVLALAIGYVSIIDDISMPMRQVAMVKPLSKMDVLGNKKDNLFKHTMKLRGPMTLEWNLIGDQPSSPGDTFELEAVFSTQETIDTINAKLILPAGVQLVTGTQNFTVAHLTAENPQKIRFVFKQASGKNEQIHITATASKPGMRFSDTAQFNTLLEKEITKEKQILLRNSMQEENRLNKVHF